MSRGTEDAIATCSIEWQCPHALEQTLGEVSRVGAAPGQIVGRKQHSLAAKTRIGVSSLEEALEKECRGNQDHQRKRDLRSHQAVAQPAASRVGRAGAKGHLRVEPREMQRRSAAE